MDIWYGAENRVTVFEKRKIPYDSLMNTTSTTLSRTPGLNNHESMP